MSEAPAGRRAQRGWIGLVVLLLALAFVGVLAMKALTQYATVGDRAQGPAARAAAAGATASTGGGATAAVPAKPVERARAVEDLMRQQADERARQTDAAAR
jgi:hypothetical protein